MYIRASQGHSGGTLVDPELLNYVATPLGWKDHLYHVGGSFTIRSVRSPKRPSKAGERSNCLGCVRFLPRSNAHLVPNTGQKGCEIAPAVNA